MMIDHHARFACKRFSRSEEILWTYNYWHVYLCCDLDFAQSVQIVSQDSLAPDDVPSNYVCRQKDQQSRRYSSNRSILMMSALMWSWHWTLTSQPFSHDTPALDHAPPFRVWSPKVERFRRYHPDKQRNEWFQNTPLLPISLRWGWGAITRCLLKYYRYL